MPKLNSGPIALSWMHSTFMNRYAYPSFIRPEHAFSLHSGMRMRNKKYWNRIITLEGFGPAFDRDKNGEHGWFFVLDNSPTVTWMKRDVLESMYEPL